MLQLSYQLNSMCNQDQKFTQAFGRSIGVFLNTNIFIASWYMRHLVDPTTGVHTNNVKPIWTRLKNFPRA